MPGVRKRGNGKWHLAMQDGLDLSGLTLDAANVLFDVTGTVEAIVAVRTATQLGVADGGATLALGVTGDADKYLAAAIPEDPTIWEAGLWWDLLVGPIDPAEIGADIIMTTAVTGGVPVLSGTLDVLVAWRPVTPGANVAARTA